MKILPNTADRKSALYYVMLAFLSLGIFLLHETGPANSSFSREAVQIETGFLKSQSTVADIYQFSIRSQKPQSAESNSLSILNALSARLKKLVSIELQHSCLLPVAPVNPTQHFRSRSLNAEDFFH